MVMAQEEQIEVLRAQTRVLAQDFDAMLEEIQRWDSDQRLLDQMLDDAQ